MSVTPESEVAIVARKRPYHTGTKLAFAKDGHSRLLADAYRAIGSPEFVSMRGTAATGRIRIFPQSEPGPEHFRVMENARYFGRTLASWMKHHGFARKTYDLTVVDGHLEFFAEREQTNGNQ